LDKFYTFYELFKKKNIIPNDLYNNAQYNNNVIQKTLNNLKNISKKYGIVLEKK
jgi:hypothetical protein